MIRFIIILILTYMAYKFLTGLFMNRGSRDRQESKPSRPVQGGEDLVEDPYCHTYIPLSNAFNASLGGKTLYFCSQKCRDAYASMKSHPS